MTEKTTVMSSEEVAEGVMSGEEVAETIGAKVDELAQDAADALATARDNYDYAEAAVAASVLAALQRVRQRVWELQS